MSESVEVSITTAQVGVQDRQAGAALLGGVSLDERGDCRGSSGGPWSLA